MEPAYSYPYSIPYIIFFTVLALLFFQEKYNIKNSISVYKLRLLTIYFLLVIIGLRGHIYSDWSSYYPAFQNLPTFWNGNIKNTLIISDWEPGFLIYSIIIKSIFPNYFIWIFINTAIDLFILDKIFKKYTNYYILAFATFFVMSGLFIEFNLYRNSKAIILFLLSIEYIKRQKFIPFLLINLLGFTFHSSALLYIPLYFFLNRELPRKIVWLIFIIGNIIFIFQIRWIGIFLGDFVNLINIELIKSKALGYATSKISYNFSIGFFERIFTFIIFTEFYKRIISSNPTFRIFYNLYLIYFIFFFYFSEIHVFTERLSILFIFSYWLIYPKIYELLRTSQARKLFFILFFIFSLLRITVMNSNILSKYDNVLWGIKSYNERSVIFSRFSYLL